MKNISYLLSLVCLIALVTSCKDDEKIRIPEAQTGANMRIVVENAVIITTSTATDVIQFDLYSENKDLSLVEIFVHYGSQSHLYGTFNQADFADGTVQDLTFNAADLASWFGVPGFADGSVTGSFQIRPRVTLNDGRVYPSFVHLSATDSISNIGTGISGNQNTGAFTLQKTVSITCPLIDISGTYLVVSSSGQSTDGCCPDPVTVSGNTVAITRTTPNTFRVSDITGGIYFEWYAIYGITGPDHTPGTLTFNCDAVAVSGGEPFGTQFSGGGTWDGATGTLVYTWKNGYDDMSTVTLVRQ